MTTRISTTYDAMIARIEAVLTGHMRLSNPYAIDRNIDQALTQGYGIAIGSASGNRKFFPKIAVTRDFNLTLTRRFFAMTSDADAKATVEKLLMEDQMAVIKDFETDTTLNDSVTMISYVNDSGISPIFSEKGQFLSLTTTFQATYLEDLT